jgi:hypothetical protein
VITKSKLAASAIIVVGAALVGALTGLELGSLRFELAAEQLAPLGAISCALLALVACGFAIERAEALGRYREEVLRLEWLIFRQRDNASTQAGGPCLDDPILAILRQLRGRSVPEDDHTAPDETP